MIRRIVGVVLAAGVFSPALVNADSIWQRHNFFSSFLYVDNAARRPGDIVTVLIAENTDIQHQDQRNVSRTTANGGGISLSGSTQIPTQNSASTATGTTTNSVNANRSFQGNSLYNINQTFTDTVTCTVVAVQPNGNLVIEGYRQRVVTREVRTLRLCGVIRPMDIQYDNTISSTFVGNLHIQYLGRGVETFFTNQSWFSRILNRVWPF